MEPQDHSSESVLSADASESSLSAVAEEASSTESAVQLQLIKPEVQPTGDARVDAALERLVDAADLPVAEQIEVFDEVHRRLQDALAQAHG